MAKYIITVCLAALIGCATVTEINVKDKFEKTTRAYRQALQWGDWPTAIKFLAPDRAIKDQIPLDDLKQIKVTSYEVIDLVPAADNMQAQQTVEIQYYFIKRMVEKTLKDKQVWVYTESTGWRLTSGLPRF
jgi:hypothetical protein